MPLERILITVKTYPTISKKYLELACTAGVREDGSWIRLYPIPFRQLKDSQRYKKYQWIEANIAKSKNDNRPESYRIIDIDNIRLGEQIDTSRNWEVRRKMVLEEGKVFSNLEEIISLAHDNKMSLAVFKPTKIIDFIVEDVSEEWSEEKIRAVIADHYQGKLFQEQEMREFKMMPKLPKKFSFKFEDDIGRQSKLMIEDWEIGQLYWSIKKNSSERDAIDKVRQKYLDDFALTKDLHFFLGTTREWHRIAPNPYVIIGVFYPPHIQQTSFSY
ncbi:MAG: hypothetical protein K0U45_01605 [Alphaproteobacteria bacterium]|nr:hypothetical protein [Alphaproteobacteria bacterium]